MNKNGYSNNGKSSFLSDYIDELSCPDDDFRLDYQNNNLTIALNVPGLKKEDLKVVIEEKDNNLLELSITGVSLDPYMENKENSTQYKVGIDGKMVDLYNATLKLENGILYVIAPRKEEKPKQNITLHF